MIDISTLDRSEQIKLLSQLEKALGWYPITNLDVDDLRERFVDEGEDVPPDWIPLLPEQCRWARPSPPVLVLPQDLYLA
jgi:hypothetical protein